jgi:hypothetical protein
LLVVVNFGDEPASVPVGAEVDLLFGTGQGVEVDQNQLVLPGHAGALVR